MIKNDYENAFELCTRTFCVHNTIEFIQTLLNLFFPNVNRNWAKYFIFVQTENTDNSEQFDKCLTYECQCAETLPSIIF